MVIEMPLQTIYFQQPSNKYSTNAFVTNWLSKRMTFKVELDWNSITHNSRTYPVKFVLDCHPNLSCLSHLEREKSHKTLDGIPSIFINGRLHCIPLSE